MLGALPAGAGLALGVAPATAATAPPDATAVAVEQVVVTAEKRSANLTTTPLTVNVLSAKKLDEAAVTSFYDIANVTPGLRMDELGTNLQPTIRGITSNTSGTGNNPNVAIYVDNFYMFSNLSNNLELADTQEIEVVKGPQGTLFGRNATGGAILVKTLAPSFTPTGKIEAGYGSFNDGRVSGYLSGPLTDTLAGSVSVIYRHYDGYTRNLVTDHHDGLYDTISWRTKLLYRPTDWFSVTAAVHYADTQDGQGRVYRIQQPEGGATEGFFIPGAVVAQQRYTNSQDLMPMSTTRLLDGTLTAEFDLGFATLNSYSGFQHETSTQQTDLDGTSAVLTDIKTDTATSVYSQEFVLNSKGSGPFKWTAGANYYYNMDRAPYYTIVAAGNPNTPNSRNVKIGTYAYAAFFDGTLEIFPSWFLTGGLRFSNERKDFKYRSGTGQLTTDVSHTWDGLTPRAVLRHDFGPNTSTYFSFSRGFKSGTYNASSPATAPVDPEEITALEVGYKMSRSRFTWNSSAYHYLYTGMQVSSYDFTQAVPITRLQNVGEATIWGLDTDLTYIINENWDVALGGAYTHARYDKFPGAVAYYPNANGFGYYSSSVDMAGKQMNRSPDWTGSLTVNFTYPTSIGTFQLSGHPYYMSQHYTDLADQFLIKARTLVDLTGSWTPPDARWKITISVKNLFDSYYISYWDPVGTAVMVNDGEPRSVLGTVSFKF